MSLKGAIQKRLAEYFDSTTIHGFSYLRASGNIIERLAWIIIIATCFILASLLIYQGIEEAKKNPISTTVETIPFEKVPFPAITIDSGTPDPWSHSERIFNGLAFDTKDFFDNNLDNTKLVEKVSIIFDRIFTEILHNYQFNGRFDDIDNGSFDPYHFSTIEQYFGKLAYVYKMMPELGVQIDVKLYDFAKEILITHLDFEDSFRDFEHVLEDALKSIENSEVEDHEVIGRAYKTIYFPYMIMKNRGEKIGFGTFLAYFTRGFSTYQNHYSSLNHEFGAFESEFSDIEKLSFEFLNKYSVVNVTGRPVNSYELIKWLSNGAEDFAKYPTMARFCEVSVSGAKLEISG